MVTTGDIDNAIDELTEESMTFVYEEPKPLDMYHPCSVFTAWTPHRVIM